MKKTLLLFVGAMLMVFAVSCAKPTTYEVYNGTSGYDLYEVVGNEYLGSALVNTTSLGYHIAANSSSGAVEAQSGANKVQVAMTFVPGGDVYTTVDYYSINRGGHTTIVLEDETQVSGPSRAIFAIGELMK